MPPPPSSPTRGAMGEMLIKDRSLSSCFPIRVCSLCALEAVGESVIENDVPVRQSGRLDGEGGFPRF